MTATLSEAAANGFDSWEQAAKLKSGEEKIVGFRIVPSQPFDFSELVDFVEAATEEPPK